MITWIKNVASKTPQVEEFDHAYLVVGTASIEQARKALWRHLGKKKWTSIAAMPARPFWNGKQSCVALYFAIGPGAEREYKP